MWRLQGMVSPRAKTWSRSTLRDVETIEPAPWAGNSVIEDLGPSFGTLMLWHRSTRGVPAIRQSEGAQLLRGRPLMEKAPEGGRHRGLAASPSTSQALRVGPQSCRDKPIKD